MEKVKMANYIVKIMDKKLILKIVLVSKITNYMVKL